MSIKRIRMTVVEWIVILKGWLFKIKVDGDWVKYSIGDWWRFSKVLAEIFKIFVMEFGHFLFTEVLLVQAEESGCWSRNISLQMRLELRAAIWLG